MGVRKVKKKLGVFSTERSVDGVRERRVEVERDEPERVDEGDRRPEVLEGELHLSAPRDVDAQDDEHGVVDEELVADGMRERLRGRDAVGEDGRQQEREERADDARGIHEREDGLAVALALGEAHVEDQEDLD